MTAPPAVPGRSPLASTSVRRRRGLRSAPAPTVLVVEDEPPIRALLRHALQPQGFRVVEAADAATGLAQCAQGDPDLVILDLGLPDRDGRELISEVRAWSRVPILVLSGRDSAADKVAALDRGGSDY